MGGRAPPDKTKEHAKKAPRHPKIAPESPKMAKDGAKLAHVSPKMAQDGPKTTQDRAKMSQDEPRQPQDAKTFIFPRFLKPHRRPRHRQTRQQPRGPGPRVLNEGGSASYVSAVYSFCVEFSIRAIYSRLSTAITCLLLCRQSDRNVLDYNHA